MAKKDEAESQKTKSQAGLAQTNKSQTDKPQAGFSVNNFLQETKEELDKVVWPSRQQLISESLAVVLMVILSTTLIYLVDQFFSWASRQVFG